MPITDVEALERIMNASKRLDNIVESPTTPYAPPPPFPVDLATQNSGAPDAVAAPQVPTFGAETSNFANTPATHDEPQYYAEGYDPTPPDIAPGDTIRSLCTVPNLASTLIQWFNSIAGSSSQELKSIAFFIDGEGSLLTASLEHSNLEKIQVAEVDIPAFVGMAGVQGVCKWTFIYITGEEKQRLPLPHATTGTTEEEPGNDNENKVIRFRKAHHAVLAFPTRAILTTTEVIYGLHDEPIYSHIDNANNIVEGLIHRRLDELREEVSERTLIFEECQIFEMEGGRLPLFDAFGGDMDSGIWDPVLRAYIDGVLAIKMVRDVVIPVEDEEIDVDEEMDGDEGSGDARKAEVAAG
ncbi:hypothetical protein EJ08DRAFT_144572 [Tothia fuscella]|uniref:Uncharacterized protein n=1 Tax=Tothia fuscella TaxID=1048955 RepID=A0A9P4P4H3_9PEZI|nr:hypothetical protein EJ08DRAFT_144572 [Tothia fuscella]